MEDQAGFLRTLCGESRQSGYGGATTYPVIVLASGHARTGKSHIARNLASLFSRNGAPVFSIDGNDGQELARLLDSRRNSRRHSSNPAPPVPEAGFNPEPPPAAGYIIVDFPGGISTAQLDCIACADETLLVARPDPGGIREAAGFLSLLATTSTCMSARIGIVVNPAASGFEAKHATRTILSACPPCTSTLLAYYRGFVLPDAGLRTSLKLPPPVDLKALSAVERDPGSPHSLSLRKLADDIDRSLVRQIREADTGIRRPGTWTVVSELDDKSGLGLL